MTNSPSLFAQRLAKTGPLSLTAPPPGTNTRVTERLKVNAHVHLPPNFSAFETTAQALDLAQNQDVRVFGASNYYDYTVYRELADGAAARGIFPLFGIEIISLVDALVAAGVKVNDPGNPGKMYLCGKGITRFDPLDQKAVSLLETIRRNDSQRMAAMTEKLSAHFSDAGQAAGVDAEAIRDRVAIRHGCPRDTVYLQERHLAQAFQEEIFQAVPEASQAAFLEKTFGAASKNSADPVTVQNEIRTHLLKSGKPCFIPDTFVGFDHAYALILALGGIPCYPTLADGASPLCGYEADAEALIADLQQRRIFAAELIPVRNAPDVLRRYVRAMRDAGMIVTAGTEHNTLEMLPIAPTCLAGQPIPDDLQEIFWEGACVVAAHQCLSLSGQRGYVDKNGRLHPEFATGEERIAAFRALGKQILTRYSAP